MRAQAPKNRLGKEVTVAWLYKSTSSATGATGGGSTAGGAGSGTGELLAEATSLLCSLRMPSMNAVIVMNQVGKEGSGMGLLDEGATRASPGKEPRGMEPSRGGGCTLGRWLERQDAKQAGNANAAGGEGRAGHSTDGCGGPPCRTVSACRSRSPGPRPVRREERRLRIRGSHEFRVEGDSVLWLRMMTLYIVAEETARRRNSPRWRMGKNSVGTLETTGWTFRRRSWSASGDSGRGRHVPSGTRWR